MVGEEKFDLKGQVTDNYGNPLGDVELSITRKEDEEEFSAKADSEGHFLLKSMKAGRYSVTVQSDGYEGEEEYEVGEGNNSDRTS